MESHRATQVGHSFFFMQEHEAIQIKSTEDINKAKQIADFRERNKAFMVVFMVILTLKPCGYQSSPSPNEFLIASRVKLLKMAADIMATKWQTHFFTYQVTPHRADIRTEYGLDKQRYRDLVNLIDQNAASQHVKVFMKDEFQKIDKTIWQPIDAALQAIEARDRQEEKNVCQIKPTAKNDNTKEVASSQASPIILKKGLSFGGQVYMEDDVDLTQDDEEATITVKEEKTNSSQSSESDESDNDLALTDQLQFSSPEQITQKEELFSLASVSPLPQSPGGLFRPSVAEEQDALQRFHRKKIQPLKADLTGLPHESDAALDGETMSPFP